MKILYKILNSQLYILHVHVHLCIYCSVPPSVTAIPPALPVVVDNTVDLVCVVTGDTPLTITWTHNSCGGVTVFTGDDTTGGNFTLTVNTDDYGSYTCNVTNLFGSDNDTINVIQAGKSLRFHAS